MMFRLIILSFVLSGIVLTPLQGMAKDKKKKAPAVKVQAEEIADMAEPMAQETSRAADEKSKHLYDILAAAFRDNPTINASRLQLNATQEKLTQAYSNFRPTVTANGAVTYTDTDSHGGGGFTPDGNVTTKSAGVDVTQPIFRGGRTLAQTQTANYLIKAQENAVNTVAQNVMLLVVTGYMDVLCDRSLLTVAENNRDVLMRQVDMAAARFDVGEITKTDVAQAEARLANAIGAIVSARANLRASFASFEQVTGTPPDESLLYPEINYVPPQSLDDVLVQAQDNNPAIHTAEFTARAAASDVNDIFGELLPTINLAGNLSRAYDPSTLVDRQDNRSAGVTLSIPLYESGSVRSRVRAAKHTANQRNLEILETRRAVKQQAIAAWERWQAAKAQITARNQEVTASEFVRNSLQDQADVGERTITDALDAVQEYERASAALIAARRDEVVALFTLAQATGNLTPTQIGFVGN